jgi:Ca2+:H+ antiporter
MTNDFLSLLEQLKRFIKKELTIISGIVFFLFSSIFHQEIQKITYSSDIASITYLAITLVVIISNIFSVLYHSHYLAQKLGEPNGTLLLTLTVVTIESSLFISLLQYTDDLSIICRSIFASLIISLNVIGGLSLSIGALKYTSQKYNTESSGSYMAMLVFLSFIFLIIPSHSIKEESYYSVNEFLIAITMVLVLYISFLIQQTITHKDYFIYSVKEELEEEKIELSNKNNSILIVRYIYHLFSMFIGLLIIVNLAEIFSENIDHIFEVNQLPKQLISFITSFIVLLPEGLSALRAAQDNDFQRSINLFLGSATATLSATLPIVGLYVIISRGLVLPLYLSDLEKNILLLTLVLNYIVYSSKKTNPLYGFTLLCTIIIYIVLVFKYI